MRRWPFARDRDSELNVVPLMNLFVVLVPLLLLSAVFVQVSTIDLATSGEAPGSATAPPALTVTEQELRLARSAGGRDHLRIARDGDEALERLAEALAEMRARAPGREIVIASTAGVLYQDLIEVIDQAAAAGYTGYSLASTEE